MISSICVFGDSVAKGVIFDQARQKYRFLKESFINIIEKKQNLTISNYAKFGCTISMGSDILKRHLSELKDYDYTFLEFGGNDCDYNWADVSDRPEDAHPCNTPLQAFREQYGALVELIRQNGGRPVLLNLPPIDPKRYFSWISQGLNEKNIMTFLGNNVDAIFAWQESYSSAVEEVAKKERVPFIDIRSVFLNKPDFCDYLCIDGIHPNEMGHQLISNVLKEKAF